MADNNQYDDVPWYTTATNWAKDKFNTIGVLDLMPPQALGPVGAFVQAARGVNKTAKVLSGNSSKGIRLPGSMFDDFLKVPDADYSIVKTGNPIPQKTIITDTYTDTKKDTGGASFAFPNVPFWVKTAIVASVVIGTVLFVKGSFNES